ncbi:MAG: flagellar basal-body MS-ring/collar protein FliF [Pseudorhodoplanes sp.]|uniref:flagellar basal-body MS-ring/collar protein FliF n=1 Tax=Pseudorhodoplanes sp. TaxID=1934341 RepID=UPI003D11583A
MQGLVEFVKTLGATRVMAMAAVAAALIGFFAFLILRVTAVPMTPLFTDLSFEDSSAIVRDLERQAIAYQTRNDGAIILVPKDTVTRLRMKLAESGLPKGGGVGYEIFDKSDALGATSFVQNINHLRALEGELSRTIRSIDRVASARVHLVLPERPLFSRERQEPSASIVLKLRGSLEAQQVRAIRHLVASAVNGLKPTRVSVVDESGRLLADGADDNLSGLGGSADERKTAYERRLRESVENIVSSVVGPGRARVQLTADFDFNRITQTTDKFDPEGRVIRSSQTREETLASHEAREGQVTVGNELPGAQAKPGEAGNKSDNRKSEEIVNYEISRTTKTEVIEGGRVNRISVAVLVDGTYTKNGSGESVYAPRDKEELDRIAALVRSAIGFDQRRGDQVEIVNLRFAELPQNLASAPRGWLDFPELTKDDIMRGIETLVMGILGLIVLFFVIRPLVRRIVTPDLPQGTVLPDGTIVGPNGALLTGGANVTAGAAGAITASGGPNVAIVGSDQNVAISNHTSAMIDIAKVQGQVHAQSVQKVGELADRNPHETVAIIRHWLHEAA